MIVNVASQQVELSTQTNKFFANNPDLEQFRPLAAVMSNQMSAKHPEYTYEKHFSELGPAIRKRINLTREAQAANGSQKDETPVRKGGPKPKGSRKKLVVKTEQETDFASLIEYSEDNPR